MAEAIFAKYSKSLDADFTIPPELTISNSTKSLFGLNGNATLDDCLKSAALSKDGSGTLQVQLVWPDDSPVVNRNLQMIDGAGAVLKKKTDDNGIAIFSTTTGTMSISDIDDYYWDLNHPWMVNFNTPMGFGGEVVLKRERKVNNGETLYIDSPYNRQIFNNNQNTPTWENGISTFNFSPFAGIANIYVRGGNGAYGQGFRNVKITQLGNTTWNLWNSAVYSYDNFLTQEGGIISYCPFVKWYRTNRPDSTNRWITETSVTMSMFPATDKPNNSTPNYQNRINFCNLNCRAISCSSYRNRAYNNCYYNQRTSIFIIDAAGTRGPSGTTTYLNYGSGNVISTGGAGGRSAVENNTDSYNKNRYEKKYGMSINVYITNLSKWAYGNNLYLSSVVSINSANYNITSPRGTIQLQNFYYCK